MWPYTVLCFMFVDMCTYMYLFGKSYLSWGDIKSACPNMAIKTKVGTKIRNR
jgi:hypothetical protein